MIELSSLINKSDRELKICIKKSLLYNDCELNWKEIFDRYFLYMKINRPVEEINIFKDLSFSYTKGSSLLYNYYINKKEYCVINSIEIYRTAYGKVCIGVESNSKKFVEYHLFESENIIKILEFLFYMLKEVLKTKTNDYLDELTDFFAEINEEERKVENDKFFKKIDNELL